MKYGFLLIRYFGHFATFFHHWKICFTANDLYITFKNINIIWDTQ